MDDWPITTTKTYVILPLLDPRGWRLESENENWNVLKQVCVFDFTHLLHLAEYSSLLNHCSRHPESLKSPSHTPILKIRSNKHFSVSFNDCNIEATSQFSLFNTQKRQKTHKKHSHLSFNPLTWRGATVAVIGVTLISRGWRCSGNVLSVRCPQKYGVNGERQQLAKNLLKKNFS